MIRLGIGGSGRCIGTSVDVRGANCCAKRMSSVEERGGTVVVWVTLL